MILCVKNLTLYYGNRALLQDVNLQIESAKTTVLLGASGSGKTLSTLALQGLLPHAITKKKGEILLDGKLIDSTKSRGKIFASIMQNPISCFNPLYSMKTHYKESLKASKVKWDSSLVESVLKKVDLSYEVLALYPFEMSGGMLQRIMIALALLSNAPFLIADEPTTDLDCIVQYKILALLKQLQKEYNLGILLITHDLDVAIKMADTVVILENGSICESFSLHNQESFMTLQNPVAKKITQSYQAFIQGRV